MQTETATDARTGPLLTPANNFGVIRVQREVGRSNFGGIFVNREGTGDQSFDGDYNRAYGVDAALQVSTNGKLFTYLARTDSPAAKGGSDYSGRVFYNFTNNLWQVSSGYTQVGDFFNPEVGYLPRRGYRRPEFRAFFQPQPKRWPWIRRISPHVSYNAYCRASTTARSRPRTGTTTSSRSSRRAAGGSAPSSKSCRTGPSPPSSSSMPAATGSSSRPGSTPGIPSPTSSRAIRAPRSPGRSGRGMAASTTAISRRTNRRWRCGRARGSRPRSATRARTSTCPYGQFHTDLVPFKVSYAFTTLANIQALVQYNNQTSQVSSNIRLALLNRSGTGLFVVYNDRRDTTDFNPIETLGRSFIVKYTRLFDF